jgi:GxxExxY protein
MTKLQSEEVTYEIIGAAMRVHNELGPGLREKPYENALAIELRNCGFSVATQKAYPIYYHHDIVGDCIPDITVDQQVLIDAKSVDAIGENESAQMLNYLRISKLEIGLVINFKPSKLDWKRLVRSQPG